MRRLYDRLPVFVAVVFLIITGAGTAYAFLADNRFVPTALYDAAISKLSAPEDLAAARQYIGFVRKGNDKAFEAAMDPSDQVTFTRATFRQMAAILTNSKPREMSLVGFHKYWTSDVTYDDAVYQLRFPQWWTVVEVGLKWQNGDPYLTGFHLHRFKQSLQQTNAFMAPGKGARQYLALFAAVIVWVFAAVTLLACALTPGLKLKWLWMIGIAVGVGKFSLDWTSGAYGVTPFWIEIPVANAATASLYSPWILSIGLPLGASVFWVRRLERAKIAQAPEEPALQS